MKTLGIVLGNIFAFFWILCLVDISKLTREAGEVKNDREFLVK